MNHSYRFSMAARGMYSRRICPCIRSKKGAKDDQTPSAAGRLRLLAGALPTLADELGVSVEDLLGETKPKGRGKRGPVPKIQQQLERVSALPKARQRVVMEVLDSMLGQR